LVKQQYQIVKRLKRLGADAKDAICLLIDLLELQQSRERRLSYLRMRGNHRQTEPNESGGGEIAKSR
jgi:hypothetical protein